MADLTNPIFTDEETARRHFEAMRWPDGPYCPLCGSFDAVKPFGGKSMGPGWYHCGSCRRKFTADDGDGLRAVAHSAEQVADDSLPDVRQQERHLHAPTAPHDRRDLQDGVVHNAIASAL